MNNGYISMLRSSDMGSGHIAVFSSAKGGETAGSVACSSGSYSSSSYSGGETAGSVACSSGGCSSSFGGGSFSAVA